MRTHYVNDKIFRAFDILETLSGDEKIRLLAAEREKALKDEASMLGAALRKGEKIGLEKGARTKAVDTAKKLLTIGVLSVEQIADATGLSLDEVRALKE